MTAINRWEEGEEEVLHLYWAQFCAVLILDCVIVAFVLGGSSELYAALFGPLYLATMVTCQAFFCWVFGKRDWNGLDYPRPTFFLFTFIGLMVCLKINNLLMPLGIHLAQ